MTKMEQLNTASNDKNEVEDITRYLGQLSLKSEKELSLLMYTEKKQFIPLLTTMGQFLTKACGNMNKLYEVVSTLEIYEHYNPLEYDIEHVKHEYGADVTVTNKETGQKHYIEIKNSVVSQKAKFKSNWMLSVNPHDLREYQEVEEENEKKRMELRKKLIESVYKKVKNGYMFCIARHDDVKLNQYDICGEFIALYCIKELIDSSCATLNFGSMRCLECKEYHKMQHLLKYASLLEQRIKESNAPFEYTFSYFSPEEWVLISPKSIPSQCKPK